MPQVFLIIVSGILVGSEHDENRGFLCSSLEIMIISAVAFPGGGGTGADNSLIVETKLVLDQSSGDAGPEIERPHHKHHTQENQQFDK
jgi:hypothetical protein